MTWALKFKNKYNVTDEDFAEFCGTAGTPIEQCGLIHIKMKSHSSIENEDSSMILTVENEDSSGEK